MKRTAGILILFGAVLTAALLLLPVSPEQPDAQEQEMQSAGTAPQTSPPTEADAVDQRVEETLAALRDGSMPPMQAVMQIRSLAEENPENFKAQFTLGLMSLQTGQFDKARQRFLRSTEIDPANPEAFRQKAFAELGLGDTAAARESYLLALERTPDAQKPALEKEMRKTLNNN